MKIELADLEDFKRRYAAAYGEELSDAEASEAASNLLNLYLLLSQPLPSERAKEEPPA